MRTFASILAAAMAWAPVAFANNPQWSLSDAAMLWATYVTADARCDFKVNKSIDLRKEYKDHGFDFDDFRAEGKYSVIVFVKMQGARDWIDGIGREQACQGMREALEKIWPASVSVRAAQPAAAAEREFSTDEIKALLDKRTPKREPPPAPPPLAERASNAQRPSASSGGPSAVMRDVPPSGFLSGVVEFKSPAASQGNKLTWKTFANETGATLGYAVVHTDDQVIAFSCTKGSNDIKIYIGFGAKGIRGDEHTHVVIKSASTETRFLGKAHLSEMTGMVHPIVIGKIADVVELLSSNGTIDVSIPGNMKSISLDGIRGPLDEMRKACPADASEVLRNDEPATPLDTGTAILEVCNRTRREIFVALAEPIPGRKDDWNVHGWYSVGGLKCSSLMVKRGIVRYFAESKALSWGGRFGYYCVSSRRFNKTAFSGEKCISGERRIRMEELRVDVNKFTLSVGTER